MKDIDFDELDRAVSSLLGKPGGSGIPAAPPKQQNEPSSPPVSPVPTQSEATAATSAPDSVQLMSAPVEQKVVPAPNVAPSPQPRSAVVTPKAAPRFTSGRLSTPSVQPRRSDTRFPITPSTSQDFDAPKPQQLAVSQGNASDTKPVDSQSSPTKTQVAAPAASGALSQPKANVAPKPLPGPVKPVQKKPQVPRPRNNGSRFMDVVHPVAAKQSSFTAKPKQQPGLKKPVAPQPQPKMPVPPAQGLSSVSAPAQQKQGSSSTPIVKRTGVMGASSMPSRVSHAGKTIQSPKSPKPNSFVDSLIPKLRQTAQKDTSTSQSTTLLEAPIEPKKLDEGHRDELLTAQAGRSADERQRRIVDEVPSPFLTDAKVEKRPLGGSVPSGASHSDVSTVKQTMDAEATRLDQQAEDRSFYDEKSGAEEYSAITDGYYDDELDGALAEFDQDVVAAEAMEPSTLEGDRPDTPPAYPPERQAAPTARASQPSRASDATMSIPQQYRAKIATPDKTPRSIYDTEEYHKPLSAATSKRKKTHPVVWILLIVLLLAVGAGLGVATYFLVG